MVPTDPASAVPATMDDDNMFQPKKDDEEATLPKATVAKIIKEILPNNIRCANDARELVVEAGMEFLQMLSSQANEACTREGRQKMSDAHAVTALKELKFEHYISEVEVVNEEHKVEAEGRKKKSSKRKFKDSGLNEAELLRMQEELFAKSRQVYQQRLTSPSSTPRAGDTPRAALDAAVGLPQPSGGGVQLQPLGSKPSSMLVVREGMEALDEAIAEGEVATLDPAINSVSKVAATKAPPSAPVTTAIGDDLSALTTSTSKLEGMEDEDDDYDDF